MKKKDKAWLEYERAVFKELTEKYPDATIAHDVRLPGGRSSAARQVDVLIEEHIADTVVRTAVDAKHRSRRIDVKEVDAYLGFLRDVSVDRGMMVAASGYTRAALQRAYHDEIDLDLDILTLDELREWQSSCAIPFSGTSAFAMFAPLGWMIDGDRNASALAFLYRRGRSREDAIASWEFMYVNIWHRRPPAEDLYQLLEKQERDIHAAFPGAVVSVRDWFVRPNCRAALRRAETAAYRTVELTGFVEFETSILFAVLFTPLTIERRNVRKLEYVLKKAVPGRVQHAT